MNPFEAMQSAAVGGGGPKCSCLATLTKMGDECIVRKHDCVCREIFGGLMERNPLAQLRFCRANQEDHYCSCEELSAYYLPILMESRNSEFRSRGIYSCRFVPQEAQPSKAGQKCHHNCSCLAGTSECKLTHDGPPDDKVRRAHGCSCVLDPLKCLAPLVHECVCRMEWYDSWRRVCRSPSHDCVCRYHTLQCKKHQGERVLTDDNDEVLVLERKSN